MLSRNICRSLDAKIVTKNLIGYWHWQVGVESGIWRNQSPNSIGNYNGVINNVPLTSYGFSFNGTAGSYIDISNFPSLGNNYTIEIIISNIASVPANEWFFTQWGSSSNMVQLGLASLYQQWFEYNNSTSFSIMQNTTQQIPLSSDVYLIYSKSSSGRKEYYNGVLQKSDSINSYPININKTLIGASWDGTKTVNSFYGYIKVVRIYNTILTPAEISQNYAVKTSLGL